MQLWKQNSIKFLSAQTISLFGSSIVQFAIIWQITLQSKSGVMMLSLIHILLLLCYRDFHNIFEFYLQLIQVS